MLTLQLKCCKILGKHKHIPQLFSHLANCNPPIEFAAGLHNFILAKFGQQGTQVLLEGDDGLPPGR